MNKLSLLTAVLAVFLFLGCISGPEPVVVTTTQPTGDTIKKPVTTTLNEVVKDYRKAVSESDVSSCDRMDNPRLKDICIRDIAVKEGKASLCSKIETANLKDICYYKIAVNNKDNTVCNRISTEFIKKSCMEKT
ncbi:MAG: hypothetical protein GF416_05130 [Candidatus Altiarchaeales archaeon]|nr:hypothetical protein [Candidatus Altiarchaeales archaeon]MBD3416499.1 hypothetical protein [Candidatus Altiarchaeales archaeon]